MLSDRELQSLRNLGNLAEEAADEIVALRAALAAQPADQELTQFEANLIESVEQMMRGEVARVWPAQPAEPTYTHAEVRKILDGISADAHRHGLEVVYNLDGTMGLRAALAQQAEPQEPVAEVRAKTDAYGGTFVHWRSLPVAGMMLYAAPPAPAAVPLTDEQISEIWESHIVPAFGKNGINPIVFARAVLAAAGEKP